MQFQDGGLTAIPYQIDLTSPRTVGQLLDTAFRVYARMPILFMFLAGIAVVPYELVFTLVTHGKSAPPTTLLLLALAELALVNPCVAALEMQLVIAVGEARRPRIMEVVGQALAVLPVVAAAEIVAGLAEFITGLAEVSGVFLAIIPAVILAVRLAVAAQVAATEHTNWPDAIRRSVRLTRGNFLRVLGLLAIQGLLTSLVALIIEAGSSGATLIVGFVLGVLAQSFCTLLISLLYFDLRVRDAARVA